MDFLNNYATEIATFSNIAICLGVGVALWQLRIYKADHKRKKKQATVEFYNELRKEFMESLDRMEKRFPEDKIINIFEVENDEKLLADIRDYLSCMERFSVGINEKIYDITMFSEMVRASLVIEWHKKFKNVILYHRVKYKNPNVYKNFDKFVKRLEKIQNKQKSELDKMEEDYENRLKEEKEQYERQTIEKK